MRNALARFSQTPFEDDVARERARRRLLRAAKRYGIVPVGFIDGQLKHERRTAEVRARNGEVGNLPTGEVTFLLTDIENSTGLVEHLDERYAALLDEIRGVIRGAVLRAGGGEVDARADEFFAAFGSPTEALQAALAIQRALNASAWPDGMEVRLRIGLHTGRPTLTATGYIGIAVHTAARICRAAHGGQILLSEATHQALARSAPAEVRFRSLGVHRLRGLPRPEQLYQAEADGIAREFPAPQSGASYLDLARVEGDASPVLRR